MGLNGIDLLNGLDIAHNVVSRARLRSGESGVRTSAEGP